MEKPSKTKNVPILHFEEITAICKKKKKKKKNGNNKNTKLMKVFIPILMFLKKARCGDIITSSVKFYLFVLAVYKD